MTLVISPSQGTLVRKFWDFVNRPPNLAVLAVLGSVLAFTWSAYIAYCLRSG